MRNFLVDRGYFFGFLYFSLYLVRPVPPFNQGLDGSGKFLLGLSSSEREQFFELQHIFFKLSSSLLRSRYGSRRSTELIGLLFRFFSVYNLFLEEIAMKRADSGMDVGRLVVGWKRGYRPFIPRISRTGSSGFTGSMSYFFPCETNADGMVRFSSGLKFDLRLSPDQFCFEAFPNRLGMNGWMGVRMLGLASSDGRSKDVGGSGRRVVSEFEREEFGDIEYLPRFKLFRSGFFLFSTPWSSTSKLQYELCLSFKYVRDRFVYSFIRRKSIELLGKGGYVNLFFSPPSDLSLRFAFNGSGLEGRFGVDIFIPRSSIFPRDWYGGFSLSPKFRVPVGLWRSFSSFMRYLDRFLGKIHFLCTNGSEIISMLMGRGGWRSVFEFYGFFSRLFYLTKRFFINFIGLLPIGHLFSQLNGYYVLFSVYWRRFVSIYRIRGWFMNRFALLRNLLRGWVIDCGDLLISNVLVDNLPLSVSKRQSIFFWPRRSFIYLVDIGEFGFETSNFGLSLFDRAFNVVPMSVASASYYISSYSVFFSWFFSVYYRLHRHPRFGRALRSSPFPFLVSRILPKFFNGPSIKVNRNSLSSFRYVRSIFYFLFVGLVNWYRTVLKRGTFDYRDYLISFYDFKCRLEFTGDVFDKEAYVSMVEELFKFGRGPFSSRAERRFYYDLFIRSYLRIYRKYYHFKYLRSSDKTCLPRLKTTFIFDQRRGCFKLKLNSLSIFLHDEYDHTFFWFDRWRFGLDYIGMFLLNWELLFSKELQNSYFVGKGPYELINFNLRYKPLRGSRAVSLRVKDFGVPPYLPLEEERREELFDLVSRMAKSRLFARFDERWWKVFDSVSMHRREEDGLKKAFGLGDGVRGSQFYTGRRKFGWRRYGRRRTPFRPRTRYDERWVSWRRYGRRRTPFRPRTRYDERWVSWRSSL